MVDGLRQITSLVDKIPCDIPFGSLCKEVNRYAVTEDENAAGVENAATDQNDTRRIRPVSMNRPSMW
jgi:hypothetical protein